MTGYSYKHNVSLWNRKWTHLNSGSDPSCSYHCGCCHR